VVSRVEKTDQRGAPVLLMSMVVMRWFKSQDFTVMTMPRVKLTRSTRTRTMSAATTSFFRHRPANVPTPINETVSGILLSVMMPVLIQSTQSGICASGRRLGIRLTLPLPRLRIMAPRPPPWGAPPGAIPLSATARPTVYVGCIQGRHPIL
jgi:hypothetical protein